GAVWSQTRVDHVERVKLDEGSLHIHVRHQESGERFLVDVPDGNLEVRGTTFDVDTHAGATRLVSVEEGVVAWHRKGSDEILLHGGDSWTATRPPSSPVAPSSSLTSSAMHASRARMSEPDDGTAAYGAALDLFRRAHYLEASVAFERLLASHPHAPQAEDASYLDALSLARAGRADAAGAAADRHLASFPASFHRKDASILVARAARDRGDCEEVRRILGPWLGSPPDSEASATSASCISKP
ncbi:MAG: FecR family protein, partial [Polyangiaceae bacterium]